MKRQLFPTALLLLFLSAMIGCAKTDVVSDLGISPDVKAKIERLGFSSVDAYAQDGGYIVENDIFLTQQDLDNAAFPAGSKLVVANSEQYHTTNLVTGLPRTITVSTSGKGVTTTLSSAIDAAITRYNNENLQLTFVRGGSNGGGTINIKIVNGASYIASAGFPSGGNPYGTINYNKTYASGYSVDFMTTVIAHEMGHCIGFRHTDYMDRSYSCGGSTANEGASTVGAIHIPGTPTTADPNSWMLACLSATTNRPFNNNDKAALDYLY